MTSFYFACMAFIHLYLIGLISVLFLKAYIDGVFVSGIIIGLLGFIVALICSILYMRR